MMGAFLIGVSPGLPTTAQFPRTARRAGAACPVWPHPKTMRKQESPNRAVKKPATEYNTATPGLNILVSECQPFGAARVDRAAKPKK
jgi:hypothetical protein